MNVFHHPPSSVRALALVMLVGVCFPALTAGCSRNAASSQLEDPDPVIEITSPEPGKIVNTTRVTIKGRAENVEEVDVNGTPASVVGGVFETKITLPEGAATVEVTAREVTDEVSFTIDVSPPVLELTSPTRGQHIDEADGKSVLVAGKVVDTGAGLSLFKINEQIIEPGEDGSFSYEQRLDPGLNEITMTAIDLVENSEDTIVGVMYGSYVDPTSKIEDGFEIEIAATAFPKVAEVIKKLLTPELVESLVKENLPIEDVNITRVSFAPVELEAIPRSNQLDPNAPGYIDFEVKVSDVDIAGDFTLSDNLIELDVQVSEATITTSMTIQADGEGSIDIAFGDSLLDLPDGALSWTVKSGGSELSQEDSDLLAGIIEDIARFAFSELLSEQIIEQLYDPAILTRTIEVFGRQMTFKLDIEEIITNASGVYVNASLAMPQDKFAQIPDVPGALMLRRQGEPDARARWRGHLERGRHQPLAPRRLAQRVVQSITARWRLRRVRVADRARGWRARALARWPRHEPRRQQQPRGHQRPPAASPCARARQGERGERHRRAHGGGAHGPDVGCG
jgi:hypothetical protein